MPTYEIGRVGRVYIAEETASYAPTTPVAPAAGDAVRHLNCILNVNKRNRVNSPERTAHPSQINRFTRRKTADFVVGGIFYPSATLNTLPDHDVALKHTLGGTPSNITLSTTFSGTPTTTGGTIASGTGLVAGQAVLISIAAGASAGKYVRWLTTAGTSPVWTPALPAAPVSGDTLKGCVTYGLGTALPKSFTVMRALAGRREQGVGCVGDKLKLTFDANNELMWEVSGPMKDRLRGSEAAADPGTFTTVGNAPPSGLTGGLYLAASQENFLKAEVEIENAMALDNFNYGTSAAAGYFRQGKRSVKVTLNKNMDDDVTIEDAGDGTTNVAVLIQCGDTEGSIITVYMPSVEFESPNGVDGDELLEQTLSGIAKGTVGNDEFYMAVA